MSTEAELTQGIVIKPKNSRKQSGGWVVLRDTGHHVDVVGTSKTKTDARGERRPVKPDPASVSQTQAALKRLLESESVEATACEMLVMFGEDAETLKKARSFVNLFSHRLKELEETEMERLIDAAMPAFTERPAPAVLDQARRNAQARLEFLEHYETLDAEQVHELYGSRASNKAALAGRWRADGKLFAVEHKGRWRYPAFQFDDSGRPRRMIARVIRALGEAVGPWQIAIWLTTPNAWLAGHKPIDRLDADPEAVLEAAREIAEPTVG